MRWLIYILTTTSSIDLSVSVKSTVEIHGLGRIKMEDLEIQHDRLSLETSRQPRSAISQVFSCGLSAPLTSFSLKRFMFYVVRDSKHLHSFDSHHRISENYVFITRHPIKCTYLITFKIRKVRLNLLLNYPVWSISYLKSVRQQLRLVIYLTSI